ncbi:MAG: hypothetical protein JO132_08650 [Streptosporangiaceae bacterium]|nr:hypothetical protein [Streptosporangiaceae bacterium]
MRHQIRAAAEAGKWAAGLIAAVSSAWYGGPARGVPRRVLGKIGFSVALPGLDAAYQQLLVTLSRVRRAVADVATTRKRLELQIGQLEQELRERRTQVRAATEAGPGGRAEAGQTGRHAAQRRLGELRRQYADIQAREERVSAASMRLQARVDAFRTAKKTIETAYREVEAAAEAVLAEATGGARETDVPGAAAEPK